MVNRHLFLNNFSVDQAKKLLPAIIQNGPPTVPKDTHRTEAAGAECNRSERPQAQKAGLSYKRRSKMAR